MPVHLTPSQMLAPKMLEYHERTGRSDGLDVIRDHLARYGATRFSELSPFEVINCVAEIMKVFETGS